MDKLVIGLTGKIASGKGTVAAYLAKNYQAGVYGFSTVLRDIIKRLHLPMVRANLAGLSSCLRSQFGNDLMSLVITADIAADDRPLIVLDGIRRLEDIVHTKQLPNFHLIRIETDSRLRYERLLGRQQNSDDNHKTYEQFLADEQAESDKQIPLVMAQADLSLSNNGNLSELHQQIDDLLKDLGYET